MRTHLARRLVCIAALLPALTPFAKTQRVETVPNPFPSAETLSYHVEWRLISAGNAKISLAPMKTGSKSGWQSKAHLESAGLVSKLYRVDDNYSGISDEQFCSTSSSLNSIEGKRHRDTKITFDRSLGKAIYLERDVTKNIVLRSTEITIPSCVRDIVNGLYDLRATHFEIGESKQFPLTDGKKSVSVRVEAQERESVTTGMGVFKTIRYEAFLFDNVLYTRKGRMFIWLTDDARRLPVQIRVRLQSFAIGTITLLLDKEEHP